METSVCEACGKGIVLHLVGKENYRWFTDANKSNTWKCGNDPNFPMKAHRPAATSTEGVAEALNQIRANRTAVVSQKQAQEK